MNIEYLREYCLLKKGVTEGFPFDDVTLVVRVMGKIFILISLDSVPYTINIKCDPDKAVELRERYSCVLPGYHMNKMHWNTIICDETVSDTLLLQWVDDSYALIVDSLTRKQKQELSTL